MKTHFQKKKNLKTNFLLNENELSSEKWLKTGSLSDSYGDDLNYFDQVFHNAIDPVQV